MNAEKLWNFCQNIWQIFPYYVLAGMAFHPLVVAITSFEQPFEMRNYLATLFKEEEEEVEEPDIKPTHDWFEEQVAEFWQCKKEETQEWLAIEEEIECCAKKFLRLTSI